MTNETNEVPEDLTPYLTAAPDKDVAIVIAALMAVAPKKHAPVGGMQAFELTSALTIMGKTLAWLASMVPTDDMREKALRSWFDACMGAAKFIADNKPAIEVEDVNDPEAVARAREQYRNSDQVTVDIMHMTPGEKTGFDNFQETGAYSTTTDNMAKAGVNVYEGDALIRLSENASSIMDVLKERCVIRQDSPTYLLAPGSIGSFNVVEALATLGEISGALLRTAPDDLYEQQLEQWLQFVRNQANTADIRFSETRNETIRPN